MSAEAPLDLDFLTKRSQRMSMVRSRRIFGGLILPRSLMLVCACLEVTSRVNCLAQAARDVHAGPMRLDLSRAALAVGTKELRPIRIAKRWPMEHRIGELLVRVQEGKIECV